MLTLELARAATAGRPFEFVFAPQRYLLRSAGGGFQDATFPWDDSLLADLTALRLAGRDPVVVQRLGQLLRDFLAPTKWPVNEAEMRDAIKHGRQVVVTIRAAAAELYALPWELLTVEATGQHIGELPGVLVRYEWPETETAPQHPGADRFLLAWSGHVPAAEHQAAIQHACTTGSRSFDVDQDVLPHVSCGRLSETLKAATKAGRPVGILHLLCHGTAAGSTFGLALNGDEPHNGTVAVDAGRLRQILAPHAGTLRLVVLAACDGGNVGALGNQLGSVAQDLHRAGIAAVVASRFPLSTSGSLRLARTLYLTLLGGPSTLEDAFLAARRHLAEDAEQLDWASLQLYARAADGSATRLVGAATLEELRTPQVREQLSQFRALFSGARRQIALLGRYKAFHDVLQELEVPFNAIEREKNRLLVSPEAWDELRDPLESMQLLLERTLGVLGEERLKDEFAMSRRRLADAAASLAAAMAGEPKKLEGAVHHVRRVLGLDLSSANNRLLATARELGLGAVVAALRSVLANLRHGRASRASIDELARLVTSLDELHTGLEALVREHDQWQEIDNNLRLLVGSGPAALDEALLSWPLVRASLEAVLQAGDNADWVRSIDPAVKKLDGELDRRAEPGTCIASLRSLWRRCNQRFVEVDRQLLRTCEELQRVGDTLDSVLKVIDEP